MFVWVALASAAPMFGQAAAGQKMRRSLRSGVHGVPGGSLGGGKAREGSLRNAHSRDAQQRNSNVVVNTSEREVLLGVAVVVVVASYNAPWLG